MQNPKPINLTTTEKVRDAGWAAEARDADGHLMTTHVAFSSKDEFLRYAEECWDEGWNMTVFFNRKPQTMSAGI